MLFGLDSVVLTYLVLIIVDKSNALVRIAYIAMTGNDITEDGSESKQ